MSKHPKRFIKVDFPEPDGPIRATYSPFLISKSMPLRTYTISFPRTKSLLILVIFINGLDIFGSNGGTDGGDVNVNVDMSETNAKIDETNSLIDELTKWLQGEDLGDDIFGDSEPPEKELTPQQLDTNIFSGRAQCPADARLSFNLLGGKTFTKTFKFKDWCDNLEIFGSFILIASYLFGAYIIVSKS